MAGETNVGTTTGTAEKSAVAGQGADAKNCRLALPEDAERLGAQADHFLAAPLKQAGDDDRACITIVLVVTNQCCKAGVENIAFAGYDKAKDRVVVQTDDKHKMICVDAEKASKADPIQRIARPEGAGGSAG